MTRAALVSAREPDGASSAIFPSLMPTSQGDTSLAVTQMPLVTTRSKASIAAPAVLGLEEGEGR